MTKKNSSSSSAEIGTIPAPVMIVSFSIDASKQAAFDDFYQHEFLPALLANAPEIKAISRYEEFGVDGSLRWYDRQYLTIYEFVSAEGKAAGDAMFGRPALAKELKEFKRWKDSELKNFARRNYDCIYEHPRRPAAYFGNQALFIVTCEIKPELEADFHKWYHGHYLPKNLADVPTWSACRRYKADACGDGSPARYLTICQSNDEAALGRSLELMMAHHRLKENEAWHQWVGKSIINQDAGSFRSIYVLPG